MKGQSPSLIIMGHPLMAFSVSTIDVDEIHVEVFFTMHSSSPQRPFQLRLAVIHSRTPLIRPRVRFPAPWRAVVVNFISIILHSTTTVGCRTVCITHLLCGNPKCAVIARASPPFGSFHQYSSMDLTIQTGLGCNVSCNLLAFRPNVSHGGLKNLTGKSVM